MCTLFEDMESESFGSEHYVCHLMVMDDNRTAVVATNK